MKFHIWKANGEIERKTERARERERTDEVENVIWVAQQWPSSCPSLNAASFFFLLTESTDGRA